MHKNYNRLVRSLKRSGVNVHQQSIVDQIRVPSQKLRSTMVVMIRLPILKAEFFGSHLNYYFEMQVAQYEPQQTITCRFDGYVFEEFGSLLFSGDAFEITGIYQNISPDYTVFLIQSVQRWYPTPTFGENLVATLHRLL